MANRKDALALVFVGALSVLVAGAGLYLGFHSTHRPTGPAEPMPVVPEHGPILYEMRSVRSDPDRVRLEWKDVTGATGYRITIMSAEDDSLFTSLALSTTSWTIPPNLRGRLKKQTVYHWRLTVLLPSGRQQSSAAASFATQ
jgi:hypothetical protein